MPVSDTTAKPWSLAGAREFISRTWESKFVRNVVVVVSGSAGAQAIAMAFAPIITRLYGPEAFGVLGIFMAIVAVITPIAALSYPIAIILPKEDSDARGIAKLSAYIALGIAAMVALVLFIAVDTIVELLQVQSISSYIFLIPLVILFAAWLQINKQWLIRKKQFKFTARVAVIQAFIINSAISGTGLFKPVAAVLIVLYTLASGLHAFLLSYGAKKGHDSSDDQKSLSQTPLWKLAKQYYDFPLYRTPAGFIHGIAQSLPILILAGVSGPASAGFYVLCKRLLTLPSTLISKSVGEVLYPKVAEGAHKKQNLKKIIFKATLLLSAVGLLPFASVIIFGPFLFGFVFGEEWIRAGEFARWLSLLMFFNFINTPCVVCIPVLKLQLFQLIYEIFSVVLKAAALYFGYLFFNSDVAAVALLSIAGAFLYIFMILYISHKSDQTIER